jgi:hypothetical protein
MYQFQERCFNSRLFLLPLSPAGGYNAKIDRASTALCLILLNKAGRGHGNFVAR